MKRLGWYLTKLFLARWLMVTLSMLALLSIVDSIANTDALPEGATLLDGLRYAALRLATLFDRIFMFALFISLLLTYLSLIRRQELVTYGASGVSPIRQIRALAGAVVALTIASGFLIDQILPPTARALDNWLGAGALTDSDLSADGALWIAEEGAFVEIGTVRGDSVYDLKFYQREGPATITGVTRARSATYNGKVWVLAGATQIPVDGQVSRALSIWRTPQTPKTLQKLATSPRFLSMWDQYELTGLRNSGSKPSSSYIVWSLNRITMPLVALGFLVIAVCLMQQHGRQETGSQRLMWGLAVGFGFFVIDGVLKTLAEGGGVSVAIAIGLPILLLYGYGAYLVLETEQA